MELGNPFGQFFRELSNRYFLWWDGLFGAFGLAYFVAAALRHLRQDRPANGGLELTFLGIAGFMIGDAALTGLGRLKFGVEQAVTERYATPMLLFWLALAMIAIIEIWRRPGLRPLAMVLSLPFLIGLALVQSSFVKTGLNWVLPRPRGDDGLAYKCR